MWVGLPGFNAPPPRHSEAPLDRGDLCAADCSVLYLRQAAAENTA